MGRIYRFSPAKWLALGLPRNDSAVQWNGALLDECGDFIEHPGHTLRNIGERWAPNGWRIDLCYPNNKFDRRLKYPKPKSES